MQKPLARSWPALAEHSCQLLGFDACEKLYEIGYEYTHQQLAEWACLQPVLAGVRCEA